MSSPAIRRPPAVDSRAPSSPARPAENPLEEFARVMGADMRAVERFDAPDGGLAREGDARDPAAARVRRRPTDQYIYSADALEKWAPRRPRRFRAFALGVLVAIGLVGGLAAWALNGAPGLMGAPEAGMAADDALKAPAMAPAQESAASHEDSNAGPPETQMAGSGPVNLNPPPALDEQAKSPATTPVLRGDTSPPQAPPPAIAAAAPVAPPAPPAAQPVALPPPLPPQTSAAAGPAQTGPAARQDAKRSKPASDTVVANDGGAPAGASQSPAASAARASPTSGDASPALVKPPRPIARPSADASAGAAAKPAKEKPTAPAKPAANPLNIEPTGKIDATVPDAPPPDAVAATPSGGGGFSADAVLQFVPNMYQKAVGALWGPPPATQVAKADPEPAAADAAAYSVEVGAPTEPAARKASARLRSLGGLQPIVRQAEVDGRKVYQVRVGGMSKADAAALCLKLKSSGGEAACSVTRN